MQDILAHKFSHFSQHLREEIDRCAGYRCVRKGTVLLDLGRYITEVFLICDGMVKILREDEEGHELFLYYLHPGDACAIPFAHMGRNQISRIRAVAAEDTEVMIIPIKYMDEWMSKYRSWYYFVMRTCGIRFESILHTLENIAFRKVDQRLLEYLYNSTDAHGCKTLHITHQTIAYELNSSREVISRHLKKLEQAGKVRLGRNRIEMI